MGMVMMMVPMIIIMVMVMVMVIHHIEPALSCAKGITQVAILNI
jgi:hypothetical protein